MESTLAGWLSTLFSLTSAAEVYCGIMKPELMPVSAISNGGRPSWPASSKYVRRSEMLASSLSAIAA